MDRRFLSLYELELEHLRRMGVEFAKSNPKIAGRLDLGANMSQDPWVERLLEGFAFLSARVRLKLEAEFPRFTQSLLGTVYPHYLAPMPSMAIVQFRPDPGEGSLADGVDVPRDFVLRGKGDQTRCEYRTAHDMTLWPLQVVEAQYHTRDLPSLELPPGCEARAGIRIRLQSMGELKFNELKLDRLAFYLPGLGGTPMRVYEQLFAHASGVVVKPVGKPAKWNEILDASSIRRVGFDEGQKLLPYDARSFEGYRLLREYFAFPQRSMFFELTGLSNAVQQCDENQLDIIVLLSEEKEELENRIDAGNFALFCTPAINLFFKSADWIDVKDRFSEFLVTPDHTRTNDFEVYQVLSVSGFGAGIDDEQEFLPFYSAKDIADDGGGSGAYYTVNRVPRTPSQRERQHGSRSAYAGSDVYLSLVDSSAAPYSSDLRQLRVAALCTNRGLPRQMPIGQDWDFTLDKSAPVTAVRCLEKTDPKPSYAEGDFAWRFINHLKLNYLSLVDTDEHQGAAAFRDLLKVYSDPDDPETLMQINGIKSVTSEPITRKVPTPGPIAFARGLEVTLTFDETAFEGTGVFLLC